VSIIGVHIHLSIAKCEIGYHQIGQKTWCTYTLIVSSCKNDLAPTPRHGTRKILFEKLMFNVDEGVDENDSSNEDTITSNELYEDASEVKHDPFEFLHDHKIPFSRLLFDLTIW
jgi:hypothetical protein